MDLKKVGIFIAKYRKLNKLTQEQLGEKIGVAAKTISKWERGVNAPDIAILNKLSEVLGISVSEILNGQEKNLNNSDKTLENLEYYTKKEKKKYLKLCIKCILLIVVIFLFLFTISNYNKFKLYTIESKDNSFVVDGMIILNQKKNIIIINNIDIKDKNIGTEFEEKIESIKVSLENDDKIVFSVFNESGDYKIPINKFLLNRTYYADENCDSKENMISKNFDNKSMNIKIEYINENGDKNEIIIPLYVNEDYASNRLFY